MKILSIVFCLFALCLPAPADANGIAVASTSYGNCGNVAVAQFTPQFFVPAVSYGYAVAPLAAPCPAYAAPAYAAPAFNQFYGVSNQVFLPNFSSYGLSPFGVSYGFRGRRAAFFFP